MKVIAFDPGYDEVGMACVEGNCAEGYLLVDSEYGEIKKYVEKAPLQTNAEKEVFRFGAIRVRVLSFLQCNHPDKIIIEMPGYFTRRNKERIQVNSPQVQKLQKGFSAVLSVCIEYALTQGFPLKSIHNFIILHDMSIKNNRYLARKKQAQEKVYELWKKRVVDDVADAAILAWFYARFEE